MSDALLSQHRVDRLIRDIIATKRPVQTDEIDQIIDRIANAPFDPRVDVVVPTQDRGLAYQGHVLGARASALTYHLVKRVVGERQWAYGTSAEAYLADLREAAQTPDARLALLSARRSYGGDPRAESARSGEARVRSSAMAPRRLLSGPWYDGFWLPDVVKYAVEHPRGRLMTQVGHATHADIDHLLERATAAWKGLAEVEQEIDSWDLIDQIVYIEEWPIQEDRLRRLAEHARAGDLTETQRLRYQELLRLVEERRPIIDRLMRS